MSLRSTHPTEARNKGWFKRDWERFGAHKDGNTGMDFLEASNYCRDLALSHYENFSIASRFVPKLLRRHLYHIYAYCRWSDDLADESDSPLQAMERLDWWQIKLDCCFQGEAWHPVMIALRTTLQTFRLSKQPFDDLLSAFRQDQVVKRYESDDQLLDYCRRSANPVGRILLQMANVDTEECIRWSDQICSGLQLTNFCQDMAEDADKNRIYFPKSRWEADQITEEMLLRRKCEPELKQGAIRWILEIREQFYEGWQLSEKVPNWLARDVRLFAHGGLAILDRIAQVHGDVWSQRIEIRRSDKLRLLLRAFMSKYPPPRKAYAVPSG